MGRWSFSSKTEADGLRQISIYWLKKEGFLDGWRSGKITWTHSFTGEKNSIGITVSTMDNDSYMRLEYTQTEQNGEKKEFDYKIQLATTSCNYGSKRYWFICPLVKNGQPCGKRVGVLYKAGDYFGCRHCYDLTYESRNSKWGGTVPSPELEELEKEIKRQYYNGKMTRKYKSFCKKEQKNDLTMAMAAGMLKK